MKEPIWYSNVFVGLTRPPMIWGVTVEYLSACFMITMALFILASSLGFLLTYIPFYCFGWCACRVDHSIFQILTRYWQCQSVPNKWLWGCQSYEAI